MNPPRGLLAPNPMIPALSLEAPYIPPDFQLNSPTPLSPPRAVSNSLSLSEGHHISLSRWRNVHLQAAGRPDPLATSRFVEALLMSVRSANFEIRRFPSNEGNPGFRASEFRLDGSGSRGPLDVGWEELTNADLNLRIRPVRGANESAVTNFIIAYNHPLDASQRAFGIPIGVRGFVFQPQNRAITEENDPIHPPNLPLEQEVVLPDNLNYSLRYVFNRLAAPLAQNLSASFITGFWHSLGLDTALYRHWNIPDNTFPGNVRRVAPFVAQIFFTPEGREYRRTHSETWGPNIPLFTFSNMQDFDWSMLFYPNTLPLPSGGNLELLSAESVRNFLQEKMASAANDEERQFYSRLSSQYGDEVQVNRFEMRSHYERENSPARDSLDFNLRSVALGFNIPLSSRNSSTGHFRIERLLASRIHLEGPSLTRMILRPREQEAPYRLVIENPLLQNLSVQNGDLNVRLPDLLAERIVIQLPSPRQMMEIVLRHRRETLSLNTAEEIERNWEAVLRSYQRREDPDEMDFSELSQYWEEVLALSQIEVVAPRALSQEALSIDYASRGLHFEARGARAASLNINSDSAISRNFRQSFVRGESRFETPLQEHSPHFSLRGAYLQDLTFEVRGAGRVEAHQNHIQDLELLFPSGHLLIQSPSMSSEGNFNFQTTIDDAGRSAILNFQGGTRLEDFRLLLEFPFRNQGRIHRFIPESLRRFESSVRLSGRLGQGSVLLPQDGIDVPLQAGLVNGNVEVHFNVNPQGQIEDYQTAVLGNLEASFANLNLPLRNLGINLSGQIPRLSLRSSEGQNLCFRFSPELMRLFSGEDNAEQCHIANSLQAVSLDPRRGPTIARAEVDLNHFSLDLRSNNPFLRTLHLQDMQAQLGMSLVGLQRRRLPSGAYELQVAARNSRLQNIQMGAEMTLNGQSDRLLLSAQDPHPSFLSLEHGLWVSGPTQVDSWISGLGIRLQGTHPNPHLQFYAGMAQLRGARPVAIDYLSTFADIVWRGIRLYSSGHANVPSEINAP